MKELQNPQLYEAKRKRLQALVELFNQGYINLFFADEVTFALSPAIPYGWLPIGRQSTLPSRKATVMKLFGVMDFDNRFYGFPTDKGIDATFIINALDQFCLKMKKPTVIVLDNARFHHKAVKLRKQYWEKNNLFVFFLPPYSPHLNPIEILWRFIKYKWLKPQHYLDSKTLWNAICNILSQFGSTYCIRFSKHF